jgi:hypothetical protein
VTYTAAALKNEGGGAQLQMKGPMSSSSVEASSSFSPSSTDTGSATSQRQFVLQHVDVTETSQTCKICKKTWAASTNVSNIVDHFKAKHPRLFATRPRADQREQPSIKASFSNQEGLSAFDDIVELFIHHPALPLSMSNSKFFRKILKSSSRCTYVNMRQAIIEKDEALFRQLTQLLNGRKVAIQIDGGKDISHTKIIGVSIVVDRRCFCWDIVPVEDTLVLTESFYKDLLQRVISDMEALGAVVVSVTLDNEAINDEVIIDESSDDEM